LIAIALKDHFTLKVWQRGINYVVRVCTPQGSLYWRLHKRQNTLSQRYISFGFPRAPHNIDAAFVWSGNGRIYFIKGLDVLLTGLTC